MRLIRQRMILTAMSLAAAAVGCTPGTGTGGASGAAPTPTPAFDTSAVGLIPAGYGTLRQEDISIKMSLEGVLVQLLPMNESVIRTLSPDAYHTLHDLLASYRPTIRAYARQYGLRQDNVWYVSFYGMAPDVTFSPLDLTIRAPGRDFTPLRVIPITPGFGQNRLQVRDVQRAFYLFDDGLPVDQPLTVMMGAVVNNSWASILLNIQAEQAHVRARAARAPAPGGGPGLHEPSPITTEELPR